MKIHVSRECQQILVPEGEKLYVFERCSDCKNLHYIPDVELATQETDEPYDPMEMPDEEFEPLRDLAINYESLFNKLTYDDAGFRKLRVKSLDLQKRYLHRTLMVFNNS